MSPNFGERIWAFYINTYNALRISILPPPIIFGIPKNKKHTQNNKPMLPERKKATTLYLYILYHDLKFNAAGVQ